MKRRQFLVEILAGECDDCGVLGPVLAKGSRKVCETCDQDFMD